MPHKMTINRPDEESIEILIDGEVVGGANHDTDGWSGMERVEKMAMRIAKKLGMEVDETFDKEE